MTGLGRARSLLVVLALSATAACGSTVPETSTAAGAGQVAPGDGLAGPPLDDGLQLREPGSTHEDATGVGGAALTDDEQASSASAPAPALPEPTTAPARHAGSGQAPAQGAPLRAADRSPLRIGLLYVNNDAASAAGVDNGNSFAPRRVLEAFLKAHNARGGLAGRRLEPTFFELKSSSSSYAADLQSACATFAEDAKVALVLSFLGTTDDQFSGCLGKSGIAHVNGSYGLGDNTSIAAQTTTVSTPALSADRRIHATLERLKGAGHLTAASRIGVVVEGCPYNQRAVERTLGPAARRLGLNVVQTHETRCFGGIDDLGGLASDAQNAVLRFVTEDVDRVMVVSAVEANVLLVFTNAAESQGYRPGYALSSLALANVLKDNVPQQQLRHAKGVGWLPVLDDTAPTLAATAAGRTCVSTVRGQGVTPVSRADHFTAFSACDAFGLAAQVLAKTGGALDPSAWGAGLDAVGVSFSGAVVLDGRTDFRNGRREGPALGRVFGWDGSCSCFRYAGDGFPL